MLDKTHGLLAWILARRTDRATLYAVARVPEAHLVAGITYRRGAYADRDASLVHHVKHASEAPAGLSDSITDGAGRSAHQIPAFPEVEQCIGYSAMTELVIEPGYRDVVVLTIEAAALFNQELRYDEQGDTLRAGDQPACIRYLGEHEVHNILRILVISVADPHLVAAQSITRPKRVNLVIKPIGLGPRRDVGQTRPGLRLRETHGAKPPAAELVARKHLLLDGRAVNA